MSQEPSSYQFIETPQGSNPTATREVQRAVRSHAASISQPDPITRRRNRVRRLNNRGRGVTVFEAGPSTQRISNQLEVLPSVGITRSNRDLAPASGQDWSRLGQYSFDSNNPLWSSLSGQTFSPISHLATYHKPYVPGIINHYISNLTIPTPELDGSSTVPLFRAAWLPVVIHDPLIFQIIVLFAATHYATYADPSQYNSLHLELLSLKQSALSALIREVQSEQGRVNASASAYRSSANTSSSSDTLIAAAAKMASFEAIFGAAEAFHMHMSTVARLLRMRGSLVTLGMNGFLARLLSFIDTNSAFLLNTNMYLREFNLIQRPEAFRPTMYDQGQPQAHYHMSNPEIVNLERFIGLISALSGT